MKEKREQMTEKEELAVPQDFPMKAEKEEPAVPQKFPMEAEKQPGVSNVKSGFEEPSVKAETIKLEKEVITAVMPPRSAEDIPRTPLSERFAREE